ncbi:MAG: hypothetical protein DRH56_10505 [Deltaproteobacteria bacterium]|nr:MAG: hypothetical protein DRH56_10505 [Deltaproteobacteria bacterium]
MFFAQNLDNHFYHTTVTCALYKGNDKVDILDRKDFNRDLKFNVDKTIAIIVFKSEKSGTRIFEKILELLFKTTLSILKQYIFSIKQSDLITNSGTIILF